MPTITARPGKLDVTLWPGYTRTATLTLDPADTGYFDGRTWRAEIADTLRLDRTVLATLATPVVVDDVMTILFDGDDTATLDLDRFQWLLIDTTLGADAPDAQPFIVGRLLTTDSAGGLLDDLEVVVNVGDINVTVSVAAGPQTIDQGDIDDAVAGEATIRAAADTALQASITAEATARANADNLLIPLTQKAAANGVATLGADSKIPAAQLPALAIGETFVVASQAAMLALTAERGDIAVRTDLDPDGFFILTTDSPSTLVDWLQIRAPGAVTSVDGQTGAVVLSGAYVSYVGTPASPVTDVNQARPVTTGPVVWVMDTGIVPVNALTGDIVVTEGDVLEIADVSGLQAALDLKAALASPTFTGVPAAPTAAPGTNTTQLANTAFVAAAITALIGTAPGVLDTLGEISDAINDDANLYTTLVAALNAKVADAINDGTTTVAPSQNAVFDALALKAPLRVTIPADKTDNYTATAVDANSSTGINVATAKNVTINTGVFTAGDLMEYRQVGAGQVTIAAGGGVTFRAPAGAKTRVQYSAVQVLALGGEVFSVSGDVTA